jgi:hypothetical protein
VSIVQELTDPRLVICRVVGVMAQVAAVHVGFSPVLAQAIGQLAGSLASRLTEPAPESPGTRVLQYADVTFSVAGELTEYLDVGRVEVRSAPDTARLRDLDREPQTARAVPGMKSAGWMSSLCSRVSGRIGSRCRRGRVSAAPACVT